MRTLLRRMVNFCIGRRTCRPEEERVGLRLRVVATHGEWRATWQPHFGHSRLPGHRFESSLVVSRSAAVHPGVHAAVTMALELSRHVMRIRVVGGAPGYVPLFPWTSTTGPDHACMRTFPKNLG